MALTFVAMQAFAFPGAARAYEGAVPDSELLGRWLEVQASQQRLERRFTGGSVLAVGAAGFAFGATLLAGSPNNELSKGGGVASIAAGAFGVGLGIFRLVVESEAERTWARWQRNGGAEMDPVSAARFEGELYAAARHARRIQQLARWLGLATTLGGIVVLAVTPFANLSSGGRVASYIGGGLLVLGGGINLASSFGGPPPKEAWEAYQRGEAPTPSSGRLFGLRPVFQRHGAGLVLFAATGRP